MPCEAADSPRQMLPPPMTTATCTPALDDALDLAGQLLHDRRVDAVGDAAHERLAAELEQDAPVRRLGHGDLLLEAMSNEQ